MKDAAGHAVVTDALGQIIGKHGWCCRCVGCPDLKNICSICQTELEGANDGE